MHVFIMLFLLSPSLLPSLICSSSFLNISSLAPLVVPDLVLILLHSIVFNFVASFIQNQLQAKA